MCKKIDELVNQRRMLMTIQSSFKEGSTDFNRYKNLLKIVDNKIYEASKNLVDPKTDNHRHHHHAARIAAGVTAGVAVAAYLYLRKEEEYDEED